MRSDGKSQRRLARWLFPSGWRGAGLGLGLLLAAVTALYVPAALAFPHQAQFGTTTVYSDARIPAVMADRLARADRLVATSPLHRPGVKRTLVLTDGGWRWKVMAAGQWNAVALRRPFSSTLVFNRSDVVTDSVTNRARTLSGTIAHETVHVLTAHALGEWRNARLPVWKREGYADFVASDLDPSAEAGIRTRDPEARVLNYYDWRRQVAAVLARNGGSVGKLLTTD